MYVLIFKKYDCVEVVLEAKFIFNHKLVLSSPA